MELRHLRYFLAVCEELNFTRAAEKLMIAQPPLSRQIRDLEEEVGAPLFIRGHHNLELTEEGQMFRQYAGRIVGLADRSVSDIRQMHDGLQGTLYIDGVEGKAASIIADWVSEFSAMYPHVQFSLWNSNTDEVTARIKKGLSDVAIVMEPYDSEGLHSIAIDDEPWIAMFSKDHDLAKKEGDTISMLDIADYELIVPSRDSRLREIGDRIEPYGKSLKVKARVSHVLNVFELCRHNVGVAIFPAASTDIVKDESVVTKTLVDKEYRARYVAVYSDEHILSPVANEFISFIRYKIMG